MHNIGTVLMSKMYNVETVPSKQMYSMGTILMSKRPNIRTQLFYIFLEFKFGSHGKINDHLFPIFLHTSILAQLTLHLMLHLTHPTTSVSQ